MWLVLPLLLLLATSAHAQTISGSIVVTESKQHTAVTKVQLVVRPDVHGEFPWVIMLEDQRGLYGNEVVLDETNAALALSYKKPDRYYWFAYARKLDPIKIPGIPPFLRIRDLSGAVVEIFWCHVVQTPACSWCTVTTCTPD